MSVGNNDMGNGFSIEGAFDFINMFLDQGAWIYYSNGAFAHNICVSAEMGERARIFSDNTSNVWCDLLSNSVLKLHFLFEGYFRRAHI